MEATELLQEQPIRDALPVGEANERNWAVALRIVGRRKLSRELVAKDAGKSRSTIAELWTRRSLVIRPKNTQWQLPQKVPAEGRSWTVRFCAGTETLNSIRDSLALVYSGENGDSISKLGKSLTR